MNLPCGEGIETNGRKFDAGGNQHRQLGSFIKEDGTTGKITDVWFNVDGTAPVYEQPDVEITADIAALPDVGGFGNVYNLHTAMALDESGALKDAVEAFMATSDNDARYDILDEIIYRWAGVYEMSPDSRGMLEGLSGNLGDARRLEALEEFLGQEYSNQVRTVNNTDTPLQYASIAASPNHKTHVNENTRYSGEVCA